MDNLQVIQEKLQDYLVNGNQAIKLGIGETKKFCKEVRLSIYEEAYRLRLIEALSANYPMLHIYMGDEEFAALGRAYIDQYPSHFRSVRWFGHHLPAFIEQSGRYEDYAYLPSLAKWEWVAGLTFDARNACILTLEEVAQVNPETWVNQRFILHPSVYVVSLGWNAVAIWQALSNHQDPPAPHEYDEDQQWMVWSKDYVTHFSVLSKDEFYMLDAMTKGQSLGDITQGLSRWLSEEAAAMRVATLLKQWVSIGIIEAIYHD